MTHEIPVALEMTVPPSQPSFNEQRIQSRYNWCRCVKYLVSYKAASNYITGLYGICAPSVLAYFMNSDLGTPINPKSIGTNHTVVVGLLGTTIALMDLVCLGIVISGTLIIIKTCRKGCKQGRIGGNEPPLEG